MIATYCLDRVFRPEADSGGDPFEEEQAVSRVAPAERDADPEREADREDVDREELTPAAGPLREPVLLAVAVRFGGTRLIDNRVLRP